MPKKPTRKAAPPKQKTTKASASPPAPILVPEEPGVLWFLRKDGDWVRHLDAGGRQPKCANARMAASDSRPKTGDTVRDCKLCQSAGTRAPKVPGAARTPKRTREEVGEVELATLDAKARVIQGPCGRKQGWGWRTVYDWSEEHWESVHIAPDGELYREAYPKEPAVIRITLSEGLGVLRLAPWATSQRRADSDAARKRYYEKNNLPDAQLEAKVRAEQEWSNEVPKAKAPKASPGKKAKAAIAPEPKPKGKKTKKKRRAA